jgi:hypothetical protein
MASRAPVLSIYRSSSFLLALLPKYRKEEVSDIYYFYVLPRLIISTRKLIIVLILNSHIPAVAGSSFFMKDAIARLAIDFFSSGRCTEGYKYRVFRGVRFIDFLL